MAQVSGVSGGTPGVPSSVEQVNRQNRPDAPGQGVGSGTREAQGSGNDARLREFQTRDEVRIERKNVTEAKEEVDRRREKKKAEETPALEPPSQRVAGSGSNENTRVSENDRTDSSNGGSRPSPSPTSVQTERGQNVDDLI